MKKLIFFLFVVSLVSNAEGQWVRPQKLAPNVQPGKGRLLRQPDGMLVYVTATGGNFFSGRLYANGDYDDAFNGQRTSKKNLSDLIKCRTLMSGMDKWSRFFIGGSSCLDSNSGRVATLTRLTRGGDPDPDFLRGVIQLKVGDSSEFIGVFTQPDEKIVAVGSCFKDGFYHFFLTRFIYNGDPDTTFGDKGLVIENGFADNNKLVAAAMQPDGKIILTGLNYSSNNYNIILVRYNPDGSRDNTFKVTKTEGGEYFDPRVRAMILQPDGKIIVAGDASEAMNRSIVLMRFNADGVADTTFGVSGMARADVTQNDRVDDIALLPDGRILLSGAGSGRNQLQFNRFLLLRFSPSGVLDRRYGYGCPDGFGTSLVQSGYTALAHNIEVMPREKKIYRLSELISADASETILNFATFLTDSALGIVDIPGGKQQNNIYPIPVSSRFVFTFELIEEQEVTVRLQDILGRDIMVVFENKLFPEGESTVNVSLPPALKAGKYLVQLTTKEGNKVTVEVAKR
jgi:uncharacterized delta-60 repeat protein